MAELVTEPELTDIKDQIQITLNKAVTFAAASPSPAPESALEGVFYDTHAGRVF